MVLLMSLGAFSSLDAVQEYMFQCERRPVALYRNLIWGFCGLGTPMPFHIHLFSFVLGGRGNDHGIQACLCRYVGEQHTVALESRFAQVYLYYYLFSLISAALETILFDFYVCFLSGLHLALLLNFS